jgi:hypothetical protein
MNPPYVKTNYPRVKTTVNKISPNLIPILSNKTPPNNGKIQFGYE